MASHLKIPVQELQQKTTSTEFVKWIVYLEMEELRTTKQDLYLAQIAAEVRRSNSKFPQRIKLEDLLLKIKMKTSKKNYNPELRLQMIKSQWYLAVGLKADGRT